LTSSLRTNQTKANLLGDTQRRKVQRVHQVSIDKLQPHIKLTDFFDRQLLFAPSLPSVNSPSDNERVTDNNNTKYSSPKVPERSGEFLSEDTSDRVSVSLANLAYRPMSTSPSASPARRTTSTLYPSTPAPELDEASALRELQNAPMSPNLKRLIETEDQNQNQSNETQDYQKTCTGTVLMSFYSLTH
jgi:hypothetical protein